MSDPMTDERFNQILIHAHKAHRLSEFKWFCQFVREADRARMSEARLRAELATKEAECERLIAEKNGAYSERNKLVAALAKFFPGGVLLDEIDDEWFIVYLDLPTGQVSWHFNMSEAGLVEGMRVYRDKWDGHSTEEKYARLAALNPEAAQ